MPTRFPHTISALSLKSLFQQKDQRTQIVKGNDFYSDKAVTTGEDLCLADDLQLTLHKQFWNLIFSDQM